MLPKRKYDITTDPSIMRHRDIMENEFVTRLNRRKLKDWELRFLTD